MTDTTQDLRSQQAADTKKRIAHAVVEVIVRDGAAALSFPAVAEQAGVSLRTVYRHYPNKEALVTAAGFAGSERVMSDYPHGYVRIDTMREFIPKLWAELMEGRDLVEVQHVTPSGIAIRGRRMRKRLKDTTELVAEDYPELSPADQERLATLIITIMSSSLLRDLVDHVRVDVDEAAFLAAYAIEAVAMRARAEGGIR